MEVDNHLFFENNNELRAHYFYHISTFISMKLKILFDHLGHQSANSFWPIDKIQQILS